ncbi:LOW QUALITY PROTEIN: hypothetical protein U9M48_003354 [Paspalum notatum var. saurae]|uniref:Integrase catalytic domain-containing protein n=1 Tax=Paspalum notatum var. saurae TaxID=547442 RepID=A0AAQ3SKJ5_PASNO
MHKSYDRRERDMFTSLQVTNESQEIVFGDSGMGEVIGDGNIPISHDRSISNVLLVDSLSYNLLSIAQLCEKGFNCLFTHEGVQILRREDSSIAFMGCLKDKLYLVDFTTTRVTPVTCLVEKYDKGWLWHHRLAYVGMRNLAKLQKDKHILGLTNVSFEKNKVCSACQAEKQVGVSHPTKNFVTTSRPLELLHMDLFGSVAYISIGGNKYGLVIVDDYSRFTWVFILSDKGETQEVLKKFMRRAQNEYEVKIKRVRSGNGKEFKNIGVEENLDEDGIKHEFSVPYTLQQNGVVERKNQTLIEAARTMLYEYKTPDNFWAETIVEGQRSFITTLRISLWLFQEGLRRPYSNKGTTSLKEENLPRVRNPLPDPKIDDQATSSEARATIWKFEVPGSNR